MAGRKKQSSNLKKPFVQVTLTVVTEEWEVWNGQTTYEVLTGKQAIRQDMSENKVWMFYPHVEAPAIGTIREKE